jgi:hypothetical protein
LPVSAWAGSDAMTLAKAVRAAGLTIAGLQERAQAGEAGRTLGLPAGQAFTHSFCAALGACTAHTTGRRAAWRAAVNAAAGRAWARACILLSEPRGTTGVQRLFWRADGGASAPQSHKFSSLTLAPGQTSPPRNSA